MWSVFVLLNAPWQARLLKISNQAVSSTKKKHMHSDSVYLSVIKVGLNCVGVGSANLLQTYIDRSETHSGSSL